MPILNYTTKIDSYKTITEIQQLLTKAGAKKLVVDNDDNNNPVALTFCIEWNGYMTAFALPCNFKGVLTSMKNSKKVPNSQCTEEQALRVGWRILKTWVEGQLAIIDADMAKIQEIFLPYSLTKTGETLYNMISDNQQKFLGNG